MASSLEKTRQRRPLHMKSPALSMETIDADQMRSARRNEGGWDETQWPKPGQDRVEACESGATELRGIGSIEAMTWRDERPT